MNLCVILYKKVSCQRLGTEKGCVNMWVVIAWKGSVAKLRNYAIREAATMKLLTNHAFSERHFKAGCLTYQFKEEVWAPIAYKVIQLYLRY